MNRISLKAHGKINLTFDILNRRDDGYHEISSVMQSIALADQLVLEKSSEGITLHTDMKYAKNNQNLAYQAAELFFLATAVKGGVRIRLIKHLPISAGLGGGSADAAAVLFGLNQLYKTQLELEELQKLGEKLGADVPFCLQGGTLLATGIGTDLEVLPVIPKYHLVLVKPKQSLSTRLVYQAVRPQMYGDNYTTKLVSALRQDDDLTGYFGNGLEQLSVKFVPEITLWKKRMIQAQAGAALMSGSGPTIIGVFNSQDLALKFMEKWRQKCWMAISQPCSTGITVEKE